MTKIIVDTNILFDFFAKTENQLKAREVLKGNLICVSHAVIYELATGLKNILGASLAVEILRDFYTKPIFMIIKLEDEDDFLALKIMKKYDTNNGRKDMTMVDAVQLAQAIRLNLPVFTTDERMTYFDARIKVTKPY